MAAAAALMCAPGIRAADYRHHTLEKAHMLFRSATNAAMYAEAAGQYEYLVTQEGIRNGPLFYNIGNSWFMAGDTGRAILNYRRAERYMPNHSDLRHNLAAALELRTDLLPQPEPSQLMKTLLGWHMHTPVSLRWRLFTSAWLLFWGALIWAQRRNRKEARMTAAVTGALSALLLASLAAEAAAGHRTAAGVIVAGEIMARKGDGERYAPAFQEPLHSGTEFNNLETRGEWRHIRLADGQTCWIPARAAESVHMD
jgi:hypothetical protein